MTASILVRGANFSGALKTNSIYPSYDKLVAAKFFGNLIPDFRGFKKDKHFELLTGDAAETNYGVNCCSGTCVTGLKSQSISTIAIAFNPSLIDANQPKTYISRTGTGAATGTINIACYPANKCMKVSSYNTGSVNVMFGDNFFSSKLAVLVVSYGVNAMTGLLYDGETFSSSNDEVSAPTPQTANLDILAEGTEVYSVSVFNSELEPNQQEELVDWLKTFYSSKVV